MIQRPTTCIGCPLNETSVPGFCPDKIPNKAKYLFLAEAPGTSEISKGAPMVGKAGFVLKEWMIKAVAPLQIAMEREEIGLANVLRCLPQEVQGRPYPKGENKIKAEKYCRQYDKIPDTTHTIILFGEHSQRLHFSPELEAEDATDRRLQHDLKGVMERIGRVYERDGRRWVFAPHPAHILRQPSLVEQGQAALRIAAAMETVVDVEYIDWAKVMEGLPYRV